MYSAGARPKAILRKHYTSDDLTGLWRSSGSNSSQKTNWDDAFWGSRASGRSNKNTNSSGSTFEEVESLNLSRSSNDSFQRDRKYSPGIRGGGGEGGWGGRFGKGGGIGAAGGGGGRVGGVRGVGGGRDVYKRHISRQSSTTSTSTNPSSANLGSSEASGSSNRDMALATKLIDFLEDFSGQSNLGVADRIHLRKLAQHVTDWDAANNKESDHQSVRTRGRTSTVSSDNASSISGSRYYDDCRSKDGNVGNSDKNYSASEHPAMMLGQQKRRRRDLIIPDEEDNTSIVNNRNKSRDSSDNKQVKVSTHSSVKSISQDQSKNYPEVLRDASNGNHDHGLYSGEIAQHPRLRMLLPSKSINTSGSFESNASPPDPFGPYVHPFSTSHAERVLMGLGFGGKEGFLPERFLRDWYSKLSLAQAKEYQQAWEQETKEKEKENNPEKPTHTKDTEQTKNCKTVNEINYRPNPTFRQDSISSSQLDEAANCLPCNNGQDAKKRIITDFLSTLSTNASLEGETRDMRIKNFAHSRQKSLPLFLETLSEEDEKRVDPFDKEAKLQMFITDVMSNSEKSTGSNSEHSILSSNLSESESFSDSSEGRYRKMLYSHNNFAKNDVDEKEINLSTPVKDSPKSLVKGSPKASVKDSQKSPSKSGPKSPSRRHNGAKLVRQEKKTSGENSLSGEKEVLFSTDSLEVADIMKEQGSLSSHSAIPGSQGKSEKRMLKNVEPAMVSIVLEDVDEGTCDTINNISLSRSESESGHLSIPLSRCSSMSLSPIPQSPVTVIEVGLDNQQDSLDTEDGSSFSEQHTADDRESCNYVACEHCGNKVVIATNSFLTSPNVCNNTQDHSTYLADSDEKHHKSSDSRVSTSSLDLPETVKVSSLDRSSSETLAKRKLKRQERKVKNTPSPKYNRKQLEDSNGTSPRQSPSLYKQPKGQHMDCGRDNRSPKLSPRKSRSLLSPVSCFHDNIHSHRGTEQTYNAYLPGTNREYVTEDQRLRRDGVHCHTCSYHPHPSHNSCEYHRLKHHCHCECHHYCRCFDHTQLSHHSPIYDTAFSLSDIQGSHTSISAHSSPGSSKSAFKSPRKEDAHIFLNTNGDCSSEKSDSDQNEFPFHARLDLEPRPISSILANVGSPFCVLQNEPFYQSTGSSDQHSPTLFFPSQESYLVPVNTDDKKGKVQQISRAVQAHLPINNTFIQPSSGAISEKYYLACDREIQCSLGNIDTSVAQFNKFVQTRIPSYEVSCQTGDKKLIANSQFQSQSKLSQFEESTKGVNTVICLIGDEHNNEIYDTLISDNSDARTNSNQQFKFVDDTLDLIEIELNAIDSKLKGKDKVASVRPGSSYPSISTITKTSTDLHPFSKPKKNVMSENQKIQGEVPNNPFVSDHGTQQSPYCDKTHSSTNPFVNYNWERDTKNPFTQESANIETQYKTLGHTFDMDKEMSAYLRPCQGMYDDETTPDPFGKSPSEVFLSPSPTPGNSDMHFFDSFLFADISKDKDSTPATRNCTIPCLDQYNESKNSFDNEENVYANRNGSLLRSPPKPPTRQCRRHLGTMVKGKSTSDINSKMSLRQTDFLQIPLSPDDGKEKARYPGIDQLSPISSRSSPTKGSPAVDHLTNRRSCSLDDTKYFSYTKAKIPISTFLSHETNNEVDSKPGFEKYSSFDQNSEHSEFPMSSSRDSLTEVSVLSSVDDPNKTPLSILSSEYSRISIESKQSDTLISGSCHLPQSVDLYLSCFDSNWDGLYVRRGYATQKDRLHRTTTNESGMSCYFHSVDALSDRSIAGSEAAQDIDEIEALLIQPKVTRRDSDSSYSDIQNRLTPSLSQTSLDSQGDEIDLDEKECLEVLGEKYDLLQLSDCGEMSPLMSPSHSETSFLKKGALRKAENIDSYPDMSGGGPNEEIIEDSKDIQLIDSTDNITEILYQEKLDTSQEGMKRKTHNVVVDEYDFDDKMYTKMPEEKEENDLLDNDANILTTHYTSQETCVDTAPDVPNPSILIFDPLSSFFDPLSSFFDPEDSKSMDDSSHNCCHQTTHKPLCVMKSDPVDKTYTWWSRGKVKVNISSSEDIAPAEILSEAMEYPTPDCKSEDLLMTFQNAQFDSLINTEISDVTSVLCSDQEKSSEAKILNAQVLSIESEENFEHDGSFDVLCSAEDSNIMDELEIIALFKNMENMSDRSNCDYGTKLTSPYPLSEIPEEDTQSEESVNVVRNESCRNLSLQETQESVIDSSFLSTIPDVHTVFHNNVTKDPSLLKTETNKKHSQNRVPNSQFSNITGNDVSIKCVDTVTREILGESVLPTSCSSPESIIPPDESSVKSADLLGGNTDCVSNTKVESSRKETNPTIKKKVFKEERSSNSGLVYVCSLNTEITQSTVLNIYSSQTSDPIKNTTADLNDSGHLSTVSFSVGDYRDTQSRMNTDLTENDTFSENAITDSSFDDDADRKRSPRVAVQTMFSQSSDSEPCVFTNEKSHAIHANGSPPGAPLGKVRAPAGKKLRSRESLLRLHEQERVSSSTGSDSDSDLTSALRTNGDFDIRERDLAMGRLALDTVDDDGVNIGAFRRFSSGNTSPDNLKEHMTSSISISNSSSATQPLSQLSITRGVIFSQEGPKQARDPRTRPRVIVQQPSDEIPNWDTTWTSVTPSKSFHENTTVDSNDHHLHFSSLAPPSNDDNGCVRESSLENKYWSFPKKTASGLWTRRTQRSNVLSPNMALLNETFKEPCSPFRADYSSTDESHPELSYLDLLPKFNKVEKPSEIHLTLPVKRHATHNTTDIVSKHSPSVGVKSDDNDNYCKYMNLSVGKNKTKSENVFRNSISEKVFQNTDDNIGMDVGERSEYVVNARQSDQNVTMSDFNESIVGKEKEFDMTLTGSKIDMKKLDFKTIECAEKDRVDETNFLGDLKVETKLAENPINPDSFDSTFSKIKSAPSRDSGFESNGSPIESLHSK